MKPSNKQNATNSNNNNNKHLLPQTKPSKVNNSILNHEEAISRMTRHNKINSPLSSRHSYNNNTNTNNNHIHNCSPVPNVKKTVINNFNKFNDPINPNNTQYNNAFRNQFLYYHLVQNNFRHVLQAQSNEF